MMLSKLNYSVFLFVVVAFVFSDVTWAQDDSEKLVEVSLAEGSLKMKAPAGWQKVDPKFNMIEVEFNVPWDGPEDDEHDAKPGRLTIMAAGGGVEANIARWISQFSQPDGSSSKEQAKVKEIEVAGMPTHLVDITGTFAERSGGPVSPPTMKDNYRMLAAIVEADAGSYFIKFYGEKATVDSNEKAFQAFVKSMTKLEE